MLDSRRLELIQTSLAETVSPLRGTHDQLTKLNENIKAFITAQNSLGKKIYWLNVILALATAGGTFVAVVTLAKNW